MAEWTTHAERLATARARYSEVMTTPSPEPNGAFTDAGVVGFVFGEMWRRGVLTARDRRWITVTCVAAAGVAVPIESHVWAALNSGDVTPEEYDEFVLHYGTQMGWPRGSAMNMYTISQAHRLAEARGSEPRTIDYEPWADPADDDVRRARGEAAYEDVHGLPAPRVETAFRGRAYLDFMYGEVWTRDRYLTRRDRRIITICCCGSVGVDEETREHLRAAMATGDMTYEELQELVFHFAVYMGWPLGRRMDDLLIDAATEVGARTE